VERIQDPQQSLLSRLATQKFSESTYFEISIGNSEDVSSRTRRSVSEPLESRDLLVLKDDEGFEFVHASYRSKRSADSELGVNVDRGSQYSLDYVMSFETPTEGGELASVDGRTAAVGEPLYPTINESPSITVGDKIKHGSKYGYFGQHTTKSPFRYTPKSEDIVSVTTESSRTTDAVESTEQQSLYSQDGLQNYAYLYDKNKKKPSTTIYQFHQKSNLKTSTPMKYITTNIPSTDLNTQAYDPISVTHQASLVTVDSVDEGNALNANTQTAENQRESDFTTTKEPIEKTKLEQPVYPEVSENDLASPNFQMALNFKQTQCHKKDVVKLSCSDLRCGVRPQALSNRARLE